MAPIGCRDPKKSKLLGYTALAARKSKVVRRSGPRSRRLVVGKSAERRLLALVFPVARLAFGQPGDCRFDTALTCLRLFGFKDPFEVVASLTGREVLKCRAGFRIVFECLGQIPRDGKLRLGLAGFGGLLYAGGILLHREFDASLQLGIAGQIG